MEGQERDGELRGQRRDEEMKGCESEMVSSETWTQAPTEWISLAP